VHGLDVPAVDVGYLGGDKAQEKGKGARENSIVYGIDTMHDVGEMTVLHLSEEGMLVRSGGRVGDDEEIFGLTPPFVRLQ